MSPRYYDPLGAEVSSDEWARLFAQRGEPSPDSWWRRETWVSDDVRVSTVWLGLDPSVFPGSPPMTWETMIFGGDDDGWQRRYSTRPAALDEHEVIVRMLRAGELLP